MTLLLLCEAGFHIGGHAGASAAAAMVIARTIIACLATPCQAMS
jgi:hypothetical protein